ncbi:MAG: LysM peptidoglycan-binding domain-containing protein [Pseudonocardiales bacterium]
MTYRRRLVILPALVLGDLAMIINLRPDVGALSRHLAAPHAWVTDVGADAAAIAVTGAALWCVALWLGLGLLAAAAAALPGQCGRLARTLTRMLLLAALDRVVAGAAGLSMLLAPAAAGAAGASPATPSGTPAATSPSIPAPTWPTDPPTLPAPGWPTTAATPSAGHHAPSEGVPGPDARPPHAAHTGAPHSVVVRPGDSLWAIAALHLGRGAAPARIAAAWPRWYSANRAVIGADADLIRPGQQLRPPAATGGSR